MWPIMVNVLYIWVVFCWSNLKVTISSSWCSVQPCLYWVSISLLVFVVQSLSCVWPFATPWTAASQASLSFTVSWHLQNSCPLSQWYCINHLILCHSFLLWPQSFPASASLLMSRLFAWGGQSIGALALASVLPMSIQGWFPLGLIGLISSQSKGLSSLLQHHSWKASVLQHSAFGIHIHTRLLEQP